jgi:hypothetical protein
MRTPPQLISKGVHMQIHLTDSDLSTIYRAAGPLDDDVRDAFLAQVALELSRLGDLGPGLVFRVARAAQKQFFVPPIADGLGNKFGLGKYK